MVLLSQLHGTAAADDGGAAAAHTPLHSPRPQPQVQSPQRVAPGPDARLAQQAVDLLDRLATPQVLGMVGPTQAAATGSSSPMLTPLAWLLREQCGGAGEEAAPGAAPCGAALQSPTAVLLAGLMHGGRAPAGDEQLPDAMSPEELEAMLERQDWSIEGLFGSLPSTPAPPKPAAGPVVSLPLAVSSPLPSSGASTQLPLCGTAAAAVAEAEVAAAAAATSAMLASPLVAVLLQGGAAAGCRAAVINSMRPPAAGSDQPFPTSHPGRQRQAQGTDGQQQRQQALQASALPPVPALQGLPGPADGSDAEAVAAGTSLTSPAGLKSPSLEEWLRCC